MKSIVLKYVSALLAAWYCLSIIGFDVHSCTATRSVFVNSVLLGVTCDEIHPEHDCSGHGSCCASHRDEESSCCTHHNAEDSMEITDDGCCTNEIEVLDSVVVTNADEDDYIQFSQMLSCLFIESNYDVLLFPESTESLYIPDLRRVIQPDCQAVLNIWRI